MDSHLPTGPMENPSRSGPVPNHIGHYKILGVLGEGGMGTVYEAEQESPRRRVALKVIKAGVASASHLRRFEHEAQVLGRLDHPGIATIFEAGTFDTGHGPQPFFAMEIVEGELLTQYAEGKKLGTRERLGILSKIADAVQHAHQKGIIHRDLKPSNILVTHNGQVKILDFGVARATDTDIQTSTMRTDIGQLIGTIPYMSPEQAAGDPDELDTRSDVYALGVVAYELLAGRLPYDVGKKMIHEAVRVIREDDPTPLSSINRVFRGDIEIIIGKALQKEKDRRYQSASDFASDIQRYLSDEPIVARAPSTWYQLSKFSKRNKALVGGVVAVVVASLAGAGVSVSFAMGEAEQKRIAIENESTARDAQDLAEQKQEEADTARAAETMRAEELEQVALFQEEQLGGVDPDGMGLAIRNGLRTKLVALSERRGLDEDAATEVLADYDAMMAGADFTGLALKTLETEVFQPALDAIERQFADQPLIKARLLQTIASTMREAGLLSQAMGPQIKALDIRRAELGDEDSDTLMSINSMGLLLTLLGQFSEAEIYCREAYDGFERGQSEFYMASHNLGSVLREQARFDEAELYYQTALDGRRRLLGSDDPITQMTINDMGLLKEKQGKLTEAESYYRESLEANRRTLGADHRYTLNSMNALSVLLVRQGMYVEAESLLREALEGQRRVLGDSNYNTLVSIGNLGGLLDDLGRSVEAEPLIRESLEGFRRVVGNDHPSTITAVSSLGLLIAADKRYQEAEPYYRDALDGFRKTLGNDHWRTLQAVNNLGYLLNKLGRYTEALEILKAGEPIARRVWAGPNALFFGNYLLKLGEAEAGVKDFAAAERAMLEAHPLLASGFGGNHPRTIICIEQLIDLYSAWHSAEPDAGHDIQIELWRVKREEQHKEQPGPIPTGG